MKKEVESKLEFRIEEFFILFIIVLSFIEFLGLLPHGLDFIKKIISWTIIGFLLYEVSLTKVFFGEKHKLVDIWLVIAYFLMMLKDIVFVSASMMHHESAFMLFHKFIAHYGWEIEHFGLVVGSGFIFIISIFLMQTLHVRKPSIMHVLHDYGMPHGFWKKFERFAIIYLVLNAFFILVVNLMVEWLSIIVDSSIVVFAVLFFFYVFIKKHKHRFNIDNFLVRIGNGAEEFYAKFISLFHSPRKIYLGFSGLLVLHLLTDLAVFVLPTIFTFQEVIYTGEIVSLPALFLATVKGKALFDVISVLIIFIFNIVGLISLMVAPAYIWWRVYHKKGFKVSHTELALFFGGITALLMAPLFTLSEISGSGLLGVQIMLRPLEGTVLIDSALFILGAIILSVVIIHSNRIKKWAVIEALLFIGAFFTYYIYHYFMSTLIYYTEGMRLLWQNSYLYLAIYFGLLLLILSFAYICGWIIFLSEVVKEYKVIR